MKAMSTSEQKPPIWVDEPHAFYQMAERLVKFDTISVDTESNSLHAYREQVCLIQFSTTREDYLVDPLSLTDLSALAPIFADPKIEKIFHAAEYDLICLRRDFSFEFAHLFDTMMAARILGRSAVGLGSMLESEFKIRVDKRFQRANWAQRPLPAALLNYARHDTHYLLQLRNRLYDELSAHGRLELAQEDFRRMARIFSNGHVPDLADDPAQLILRPGGAGAAAVTEPEAEPANSVWRISGIQDLTPRQVAILSALAEYRERQAEAANQPPFKIINNQALISIAMSAPQSRTALGDLGALSSYQYARFASGVLEAVQKGLAAPPMHRPSTPRPDDRYLQRLEALRGWRKRQAQAMGVESDVVLPRDLLYTLAEQYPRTREALSAILAQSPWRFEHFGDDILAVLTR